MKARRLVSILILILAVLTIVGSCATKRKVISDLDFIDAFSGTWVNTEIAYTPDSWGQKCIISSDMTYKTYKSVDSEQTRHHGKITILDNWIDSKGTIWYKAKWENYVYHVYGPMLGKISESGNTLEFLYVVGTITIDKWDPDFNLYYYAIYYRQ